MLAKPFLIGACAAILFAFILQAITTNEARHNLNARLVLQRHTDEKLCREIGITRRVMVIQLNGALLRLRGSIPNKNSPIRQQQESILKDGIKQLTQHRCKEGKS